MSKDVEVVERTAATVGLEELYLRHAPNARAMAFLLVGSHEAAEDLVQDAFIRVAGRLTHIRNRDVFWFYLRRTIVNLHLSRLRRLRQERAFVVRERVAARSDVELPDVPVQHDLWNALELLPARQRAALVLRYHLDLPEREVADLLRCTAAAAKSLIRRGLAALREAIDREDT